MHLLAYLPDPTHPGLVAELDRVLDGRNSRLPAILAKLRGIGIDIEAKDVRRLAGDAAAMGRPHVADALVEKGVVADRDEAFARFLGAKGPAYVDRYAADLTIFDPLTIDRGPEVASDDFPGEGLRWIRRSVGMEAVVVGGTVTWSAADGYVPGARAGVIASR